MVPTARPRHAARPGMDPRRRWYWLLVAPVGLPLATPLYNRLEPALWGVPFFYWCQLAFVALEIAVITLVYQATKELP